MWLSIVLLMVLTAHGFTAAAVPTYDTIIVGLGASGCAAASVLSKAGKKVLALEAQNRIGGRVHTKKFGSGVVELGAEWIHGTVDSPTYDLANEYNITLLQQDFFIDIYRSDGSTPKSDVLYDLFELAFDKIEDPPKDPEPLGHYLTRKITQYIEIYHSEIINKQEFITEFLHLLERTINDIKSSSSWNDVTTHGSFRRLKGLRQMSWHNHGFKTLFEILLNYYNNGQGLPNLKIKFKKVVTKISYPSDPKEDVEVMCEDGFIYRARNVILTASLNVLKETHNGLFSPPLPSNKIECFDYISMGSVGKIILDFDEIWWTHQMPYIYFLWREEDLKQVRDEDLWTTKVDGISTIMGSNTSVSLTTTGNESKLVETLPHDVVLNKTMALIRKFMGKNINIPEPRSILTSKWYSNPYIRGAYSFDNLKTPFHPLARSILAEPINDIIGVPRVLFAGEATNRLQHSTVNGAVASGYREANRLLSKKN